MLHRTKELKLTLNTVGFTCFMEREKKRKYILKGYVSCNHAGFIKCRRMSPNNTQEDYNCQSELRSCSCFLASLPWSFTFPGHSSTEQDKECKDLFNYQKTVPAKHGTDFQFLNMSIMKFLKGETRTKARVEAILCGPMNGTRSHSGASQ